MTTDIETAARAIMAVIQPDTGTRATGTVTVTPSSSDTNIPRNSYLIPTIDGRQRPDMLYKIAAGSNDDDSWTAETGGTDISALSNIGGTRHNVPDGTVFHFSPEISGISTVISNGAFSGGADATTAAALSDVCLLEHAMGPNMSLDLRRSTVKGFPAVLVQWSHTEPGDGATTSQVSRGTRTSADTTLYKEVFALTILVSRAESSHVRRSQGLTILESISTRLTDRHEVDGQPFSNPSGIQILRRARNFGQHEIYKQYYVYTLMISIMRTMQQEYSRTYSDLEWVNMDIVKPQDPAQPDEGDFTLIDDALIDMTPETATFWTAQDPLSQLDIDLTVNSSKPVFINFGDDTIPVRVDADGTEKTVSHSYTDTVNYQVTISGQVGEITTFDIAGEPVYGDVADLATMESLVELFIYGTDMKYSSATLPAWSSSDIRLYDCAWTATMVDQFLIDLADAGGTNGVLDISGTNAARTSDSDDAYADLVADGWTITVNT